MQKTGAIALASAVGVNLVCSAVTFATGVVPRGMESDACMPYTMVAPFVAARMHVYAEGGWGMREWDYLWGTGGRVVDGVLGGVGLGPGAGEVEEVVVEGEEVVREVIGEGEDEMEEVIEEGKEGEDKMEL